AEVSFQKIKILNKVYQYDILIHIQDNQDGKIIFVYNLLVIDIVTRFKSG
ncbi:961_t:CDS:1, partial [Acaulospora morrowiae]